MSANINHTKGTITGLTPEEAAARLEQLGPNMERLRARVAPSASALRGGE